MILEKKNIKIRTRVEGKKYLLQFLPEDLVTISETENLIFNNQKIKTSYIIDIVHNLILKFYLKKENQYNLSSLILKEKYGAKYNYYINYLLDKGIIFLVKNYFNGKNTKIYKINENILNGKILRFKNKDKVLLKKYKNAISFIEKINLDKNEIEFDIKKRLVSDLFNVQIEYERSMCFLDQTEQDFDTYNRNKYSVECINDNHIFYHFDSYGRLHTNFTILKSFIRKNCLLIDNKETFEIDIKNSQPLFFYILLSNYKEKLDIHEVELFKYLTVNGLFYQFLIDNSDISKKDEAKSITYKVLFGRNYKSKEDTIFCNLFPSIYNFIKDWKKEKGDYRFLSYELQKMESNFIFNKVIKKLYSLDNNIKVITVHDSIIVNKDYVDIASIIFNKYLKELIL